MKSKEDLVRDFAKNVLGQRDALTHNDAKTGNRHAQKYMRAWDRLRAQGDEGREALATLLGDEQPDVRGTAAAYLLRFRTAECLQTLREVASGHGLAAFSASQTLERWAETRDKEKWGLDPA